MIKSLEHIIRTEVRAVSVGWYCLWTDWNFSDRQLDSIYNANCLVATLSISLDTNGRFETGRYLTKASLLRCDFQRCRCNELERVRLTYWYNQCKWLLLTRLWCRGDWRMKWSPRGTFLLPKKSAKLWARTNGESWTGSRDGDDWKSRLFMSEFIAEGGGL